MLSTWGWAFAATGAGAAAVIARTCAYWIREAARRRTLRVVLHQLSHGGGSVEVTDQDGASWTARRPDGEQE
ncbi:hypothetical protein ACM614_12125 [Streptomyces sp. 12297]|uniref:hypothetical protein n=1 Tax=Streptomyces sp. NBC_00239 TaxID=2903640 RepID=UPI002E2E6EB2|nr:hypothetical protein [Streptomyces sp. NBC_00239]